MKLEICYSRKFALTKSKFLLVCLLSLTCSLTAWPEDGMAENKSNAYMGVGSCSSSNCHGSVSPRKASNVLQDEYVTWEKHDLHSKAWINLTNEDSKRIGINLGISAPEKEPLCLRCHATYLDANARQGSNYHVEDGVSCESCHGAAENYLGPHTARDSTRKSNLEHGMSDLVSPENRVKLCASCHFGGEDKHVNHRLIGAGHPRLSFELDTFGMIEPRHWVLDDDYKSRKGDYNSAQAWLVGQAYLAEKTLERLKSERLSKNGIFPELTIFYCYSCHHSLTEDQWKTRDYAGKPGELILNISSIAIIRNAMEILDAKRASKLQQNLKELHEKYQGGDKKIVDSLLIAVRDSKAVIESATLNDSNLNRLLKQLVTFGANTNNLQYEDAEQIAMGASSIIATRSPDGSLYKKQSDSMYAALKNPKAFNVQEFNTACELFAASL